MGEPDEPELYSPGLSLAISAGLTISFPCESLYPPQQRMCSLIPRLEVTGEMVCDTVAGSRSSYRAPGFPTQIRALSRACAARDSRTCEPHRQIPHQPRCRIWGPLITCM